MTRKERLDRLAGESGLLAVYLFGSRADDGLRLLAGEEVAREGSDLDVGVVFRERPPGGWEMAKLQIGLEDVFEPLRVDLVPLQRVDALFQYRAIDGHRVAATDSTAADLYELLVLRQASELAYFERQREIAAFGFSTL
jgi:predicted nucleotidyltransferase